MTKKSEKTLFPLPGAGLCLSLGTVALAPLWLMPPSTPPAPALWTFTNTISPTPPRTAYGTVLMSLPVCMTRSTTPWVTPSGPVILTIPATWAMAKTSYGYAVKGVEFTYLRVADIVQFTESAADGAASNHVEVLYGIDKTAGAGLLAAIGLADGAGRYENADNSDKLDSNNYYYQSDVLIDALRTSLEVNATTVKNALENYVKANGVTALPLTDAYGHTSADGLPLGLYLVVETTGARKWSLTPPLPSSFLSP